MVSYSQGAKSMNNVRISIALLGVFALTSIVAFSQDNSAREAKDRPEIEALMWTYTRALDTHDAERLGCAAEQRVQHRKW
jgi:hypothetical protein